MEPATSPTVVVIEDSPVVQHLFRVTLAPLGVQLVFADDGEAGLQAVIDLVPDVVLLDIGLPKLDGWGVLTHIRSHPSTISIPVIVVTAHAQPSFAATAEQYGADGFVTKPFRPGDLRSDVGMLLDHRSVGVAASV
jgi:two-component system response regulator AdeR